MTEKVLGRSRRRFDVEYIEINRRARRGIGYYYVSQLSISLFIINLFPGLGN
mgnify:CR=1 FL=1